MTIPPVSGGNASNIPMPNYNSNVGTEGEWQSEWQGILQHIDSLMNKGDYEEAVMYVTGTMFMFLSDYSETYQMGSEANDMNALTSLDQFRNAQEEDFDKMQLQEQASGWQPGQAPTQAELNLAQDAQYAQQQINSILNDSKFSGMLTSIAGDVSNQENIILSGGSTTAIATNWLTEWMTPSSETGSSSSSNTNNVQPTVNALTALSNDFSSQSSVAQSELKYYQSNDAQYQSIDHDSMQSIIDQEKAMVTAMQGASN